MNHNEIIKEEYHKAFPDPMTEKYGEGFALYCSNCKGDGVDERINWWLDKVTLSYNAGIEKSLEVVGQKREEYSLQVSPEGRNVISSTTRTLDEVSSQLTALIKE